MSLSCKELMNLHNLCFLELDFTHEKMATGELKLGNLKENGAAIQVLGPVSWCKTLGPKHRRSLCL